MSRTVVTPLASSSGRMNSRLPVGFSGTGEMDVHVGEAGN